MEPNGHAAPSLPSKRASAGSASLDADAAPFDNHLEAPHIQKRPRRTHARRSCQMCQQRKARCELPDLEVPSSALPLPDHQKCHRCKTLQISCIVDDANRKKTKKPAGESGYPRSGPSQRQDSASTDRRALRKSSTNASMSSSLGDATSIHSNGSSSAASLLPSGAEPSEPNHLKFAGGRELGDQIVNPAEPRLVSKTPASTSDEDQGSDSPPPSKGTPNQRQKRTASASSEHIKTQDRRDVGNIDVWERFSTRSRPLTLLTELVPRQNGFASKVFRLVSARATIETDVTEIISNEKSKQLSDWCENNLTLWMPHLGNAYQLRQDALQGKQTLSTQLLEQVLYLIAMQHIRDPRDDVARFSITRFCIRDLARLMMTSPRSPAAVQALELLALFPVDVSAIPGPCRNRVRTDSQIGAAERSARSIRLDRVALTSAAPYSFVTAANQMDEFEIKRTAMIWASVKTWYNCFTIGDDELYESIDVRFFSDDWSQSLVLPLEETLGENRSSNGRAITPENELFSQKRWSRQRRIGSVGLAMRCLLMKQLLVAFDAIGRTSVDLPETDRLASLSNMIDNYRQHVISIDEEFQSRLVNTQGGSDLLRTWLTIEATAGYLLVLGAGILRGLGIDKRENVPAHELALLIRGENATPGMREFLTRYGEERILAAEKVLVSISALCRDARAASTITASDKNRKTANASQDRWIVEGQSRPIVPLVNICGYVLEAAFNAMEMHATMFKLWKTPPKRSESWQLVFSNVVTAMLSLDPKGSVLNGSIPATCAYILQGMLKVIVAWTDCSRKKDHQRSNSTSSAAPFVGGLGRPEEKRANDRHSRVRAQQQLGRSPAGASPEFERYLTLLHPDLAMRNSFDVAQGVGAGPATSRVRDSGAYQPGQAGLNGTSSSYNMVAFEPEVAAFPQQYSNLRGGPSSQNFAPDTTESLAAALPRSGSWTGEGAAAPSYPQHPHTNYFGPYGAPSANTNSMASSSSNASSHTHTPPALFENGVNGVGGMVNGGGNGILGDTAANGSYYANDGDGLPSVAMDSLDFILNDVLGSSEWSGILQDIWRTEM
ncbi:uncharacterized protein SPSC_02268 [Sporisorium scitamineum]|uniref:Uncharacterized protein n=1 Tax=Sporisorium scitamineum TaxID=49012 RepID=A0A0F7S3H1_9BASI|nr:hypothetical protein [Sporisorium scitamineum]CDU23639.1 uncharacterized protein SPSC_02268 [Sporisorium scitamineum]